MNKIELERCKLVKIIESGTRKINGKEMFVAKCHIEYDTLDWKDNIIKLGMVCSAYEKTAKTLCSMGDNTFDCDIVFKVVSTKKNDETIIYNSITIKNVEIVGKEKTILDLPF